MWILRDNLLQRQSASHSKLLSLYRSSLSLDPKLWLPMSNSKHSRCARWRLGWLPDGQPKPYTEHLDSSLSKKHATQCLDMHRRLQMLTTIKDPLYVLLNLLFTRKTMVLSIFSRLASPLAYHMSNSF